MTQIESITTLFGCINMQEPSDGTWSTLRAPLMLPAVAIKVASPCEVEAPEGTPDVTSG